MNKNILIVEAGESSHTVLKQQLKADKYHIHTESTAKAAINTLNSEQIDLVLLDLMLPDSNGDSLLKEIKRNPATKNIPIIIVSENGEREMVLQGIDAGAIDYLISPYSIEIVKKRIDRCLKNSKLPLELKTNNAYFKNSKIMLIDDQELNRDVLAHRLKKSGYQVSSFTNGQQALKTLSGNPFDLILLDILMPDMSGVDVLKEIRKLPAHKDTPVIMITALDDNNVINECMSSGADDYILKPFNTVLLKLKIFSCLQERYLPD